MVSSATSEFGGEIRCYIGAGMDSCRRISNSRGLLKQYNNVITEIKYYSIQHSVKTKAMMRSVKFVYSYLVSRTLRHVVSSLLKRIISWILLSKLYIAIVMTWWSKVIHTALKIYNLKNPELHNPTWNLSSSLIATSEIRLKILQL